MSTSLARITIAAALIGLVGCGQSSSQPSGHQLANDQTVRIPISAAPEGTDHGLDPGWLSDSTTTAIAQNVFDGLYAYDSHMREVPVLAAGPPVISSDGRTYTFHLRPDARFWNGDPVTASDFVFSWNRAAALQGNWATAFAPVLGYDAVMRSRQITSSSHLDISASDAHTLVAHLSEPTGYWMAELVLPVTWVVDEKVVDRSQWWTTPDELVGTGAFRMTNWKTTGELDFAPVANWWRGSTGAIKRVELHVTSTADGWIGYAAGNYDILGYGAHAPSVADIQNLAGFRASSHRSEVHSWPLGSSVMVGFNLQSGPLSGFGNGRDLREALSLAIDRQKLADAVCQAGTLCAAATGGVVAKGLTGYLGDGTDPGARFDPATARATVKRIDPDGKLLQGVAFYYPVRAPYPTAPLAANLSAQWAANLGVPIATKALDNPVFYGQMSQGRFTMWRLGWLADYDNPQDWFDNLFLTNGKCNGCASSGTEYDRPGFAQLIAGADGKPLASALPAYLKAGRMVADDYAMIPLFYPVHTVVIKPYLEGYTPNALWEPGWTSLLVLQH